MLFHGIDDEDNVKCFSCDICLAGWTEGDKAWYAHAKYSPQCEYLKIANEESVTEVLAKIGLVRLYLIKK